MEQADLYPALQLHEDLDQGRRHVSGGEHRNPSRQSFAHCLNRSAIMFQPDEHVHLM